jgi:geranylgeranyl pyrophosphate synthase
LVARGILAKLQLPEAFVGWTMVVLWSEFWRDEVAAVPPERRLLLLPPDLPASVSDCMTACRQVAEDLGYQALVTVDAAVVLNALVSGSVDAIVGVAALDVLEKAYDRLLLTGVPCLAVPLCVKRGQVSVDEPWLREMIGLRQEQPAQRPATYLHLLRAARQLFEREQIERLTPRLRGGPSLAESNGAGVAGIDPIAATEAIAYDFLARGGKYARPFITLAAHDAMTGARGASADGQRHLAELSDAVRRVAVSIETFHKASLVHDDIEDGDHFRYGQPTLHCSYGLPTAINVGDYMIGLGYRLVSRDIPSLGAEAAGDILDILADAHLRLSEGQGAELLWRDARDKQLSSEDALQIYALKTAPAFEAALLCGLRCAGPIDALARPLKQFARHLGIAFQILNDLKDWQGDQDNKLACGLDTLGGRPTVLWALALEQLDAVRREEFFRMIDSADDPAERVARVEQTYREANVFESAHRLVDEHQVLAEKISDALEPESLRRLLYYLVDTVLERPTVAPAVTAAPCLPA